MYIFYLVLGFILLSILVSIKKQDNMVILEKESTIFIRGIAILFIMLHHLVQRTIATNNYVLIFNWIGFLMVGIFFLLSGYGNTFSVKKDNSIKFLVKRILRLLITLILIYVIYIILLAIFKGKSFSINEIFSGLVTTTWFWYIKIQILAYILLFVSYKFFRKNSDIIVFILTLISVIIMILMGFESYWWNSILCFPIGCILAEKKDKMKDFLKNRNKYIIIPLSLIIFLIFFYLGSICEGIKILASISLCLFVVIVLFYYKFNCKIISFLGNISLEIYLWHLSLIIILFNKGKNIVNLNLNLIMYFVISLGLAYLTNIIVNIIMKKLN